MSRKIEDEMRAALIADIIETMNLLDFDFIDTLHTVVGRFLVNQRRREQK